jgi:exopolysaccharide biosynthesis protein
MGKFNEQEARNISLRDGFSSYPTLILNGEPQIAYGDGGWGIAPRTAIGQRRDGAVLLLTIDGRQSHSIGATLLQVQRVLMDNHAHNAVGLDGGRSTAMYYRGEYLNNPSLGIERYIATAFLVR